MTDETTSGTCRLLDSIFFRHATDDEINGGDFDQVKDTGNSFLTVRKRSARENLEPPQAEECIRFDLLLPNLDRGYEPFKFRQDLHGVRLPMIRIHSASDVPRARFYVVANHSTPRRERMHITPARSEGEALVTAMSEHVEKQAGDVKISGHVPLISSDRVEWSMPVEHALMSDLQLPRPLRKGARG